MLKKIFVLSLLGVSIAVISSYVIYGSRYLMLYETYYSTSVAGYLFAALHSALVIEDLIIFKSIWLFTVFLVSAISRSTYAGFYLGIGVIAFTGLIWGIGLYLLPPEFWIELSVAQRGDFFNVVLYPLYIPTIVLVAVGIIVGSVTRKPYESTFESRIVDSKPIETICPHCKTKVPNRQGFCSTCGKSILS